MDNKLSFLQDIIGKDISRRNFLKYTGYTGLTTLGAGSLLAACGGSDAQQSAGPAPKGSKVAGNLTLVYMGDASSKKAWDSLFALFSKDYPDVKFTAKAIPSANWAAFFDTVSTQIAGGQNYDIIQVATEGQRLFASRGLVEPIDAYIARDKDEIDEFYSDIHPNLVKWNKEHSSPDGKTYYLPGEFNTMCMWYNSEMFKQAGVDEPSDDWKWNDFLAASQKITKPGQVFGMSVTPEYFVGIMPWLLTNGASTLSADWKQSTVNSPAAIEAAKFMRELVAKKISPLPGGTFDAISAMSQGKLAMFGGGRWPVLNVRKFNLVDKVKIVPWPQKTQKGSPIGWNAYPIMKASQNKEAAWAFVKFITTKKASEYFAQQGGTIVPPRKSVATSDAFLANAPKGSEKLYEALDYATPIPSPDKGSVIQKAIEDTWKQILAGNTPAEQALAQLDQTIKANL
ncbi:ABC transporter substrate-binding protein [Ktedonosporobacter rubrisoli]|nr:sugar ABC transporter substrate-binding protein [Ktedonosporobacter rubrisoli]